MKTDAAIRRWAEDEGLEFLIPDGYPEAFLGVHRTEEEDEKGEPVVRAVYDEAKILQVLRERDGMSAEEAVEFFEFNVAGAYVGPGTPIYLQCPGS